MDRRGFLTVAGAALAGVAAPAGRTWPAVPAAAVMSAFGAVLPRLDGAATAFAAACGAPLVRDAGSSAVVREAVAAGRAAFGCLAVAPEAGAPETGDAATGAGEAAGSGGGAVVLASARLGGHGFWSRHPAVLAGRSGTLAHDAAAGAARPLAPDAACRALETGEATAVLGLGPAADTTLGLHRIAPYLTLDPARPGIWIVWLAHAPRFEALGRGAQAALRRAAAEAARLVPPPVPLHDLAARGVQVRFAPSGAA